MYGVIEQGRGAFDRVHGVEAVSVGSVVDLEVAHDVHRFFLDYDLVEHHGSSPHSSAGGQLAVELGYLEPAALAI